MEDEKQLCDTVAKSLYDAGYEVDTCYDGETALECILAENYDLIVLDLNLPGMDGMEILRELRQSNEETKVLILSARGQIADKVEGLDAGANDYMEKPFHLQEQSYHGRPDFEKGRRRKRRSGGSRANRLGETPYDLLPRCAVSTLPKLRHMI